MKNKMLCFIALAVFWQSSPAAETTDRGSQSDANSYFLSRIIVLKGAERDEVVARILAGGEAVKARDYPRAFGILSPLAESGETSAQVILGYLYDAGLGVPVNYATAEKWYRLSATNGNYLGQYRLGEFLFHGRSGERRISEAIKWLRLAAEKDEPAAQYRLGEIYENGTGMERNVAEAIKWYGKSAQNGNVNAQYNLGIIYMKGLGVAPNYEAAIRLLTQAAVQGDDDAMVALGLLCMRGLGVPRDNVRAHMWFTLALESGDGNTENALAHRAVSTVTRELSASQLQQSRSMAKDCLAKQFTGCSE